MINFETENPIMLTDGYKPSQWKTYPPGLDAFYSYFGPRGGDAPFHEVISLGWQYVLQKYLTIPITRDHIDEAEDEFQRFYGRSDVLNRAGFERIVDKHGGYWPVSIRTVPEGTVVPKGNNVLMTAEATDPELPWVPNYLETLLVQDWYPASVGGMSLGIYRMILEGLQRTGTPELAPYKLCDFGVRGASSMESAKIGGAAFLSVFDATDNWPAVRHIRQWYKGSRVGGSIPATEHSNPTSWGRENEVAFVKHYLEQYPSGMIACIGDTYDIFDFAGSIVGDILKPAILGRDGVFVVRPDSGTPEMVVPRILQILADKCGSYVNAKGYRVLNDKVRVIQGDGNNFHTIKHLIAVLELQGWSLDNLAFGMGGALLQQIDRDTCSFAMKGSWVRVDGVEREIYKQPVTDSKKNSLRGRLALIKDVKGLLTTVAGPCEDDILVDTYLNGEVLQTWDYEQVRERVRAAI